MALIEISGVQVDTDNIEGIEATSTFERTNILLKNPPSGSVTVPLDYKEVVKMVANVGLRS